MTRRTATATALAVLAGCLATGAAGALTGTLHSAVASYDSRISTVPGVEVVSRFPAVRSALVRGDSAALARLARADGVRGVSPDSPVSVAEESVPDSGSGVYPAQHLKSPAGASGAGLGVRVAVVDTGVSDTSTLNRASGRLVDGADSSTVGDGGTLRTSGQFIDGYGHGTFMATVLAGGKTGSRNLGVAPGATVVAVRVARPDGTSSLSKVLAGLDWVARPSSRIDVANLSLAHERPRKAYGADPLTDAVERVRDAGVAIVVASGNKAGEVGDPGFTPRAMTVGAADLTGAGAGVAPFSGSDVVAGVQKPDVVASGVAVLGMLPDDSVIARSSTKPARADGLWRGSGTSQATAVTSALAALLLQRFPDATPAQVKASLRSTATDLAGNADGQGLVDVAQKLTSGPDGQPLDGSNGDPTGEGSFSASSWGASSWGASSWGASSWGASSWGASSWGASSWGASSWGASSWAGRFDADGAP